MGGAPAARPCLGQVAAVVDAAVVAQEVSLGHFVLHLRAGSRARKVTASFKTNQNKRVSSLQPSACRLSALKLCEQLPSLMGFPHQACSQPQ